MFGIFSDEYPTLGRLLQDPHDRTLQARYLVRQVFNIVNKGIQVGHFVEERHDTRVCFLLFLIGLKQNVKMRPREIILDEPFARSRPPSKRCWRKDEPEQPINVKDDSNVGMGRLLLQAHRLPWL